MYRAYCFSLQRTLFLKPCPIKLYFSMLKVLSKVAIPRVDI